MQALPLAKRAKRPTHQSSAALAQLATSDGTGNFDVQYMPLDKIKKRVLHPSSVHYSLPSSCWIATIYRHSDSHSDLNRPRYSQFEFASEAEAKQFCKTYSPPKMDEPRDGCFICNDTFSAKQRPYNCRNCGVCVCDKCSPRWIKRGVPKTYLKGDYQAQTVRLCTSCIWLSNAFCFALLKGRYHDATQIYESGNVNLRTCFADIRGESLFPVHACTLGGNLELLKWLVDKKLCPISVKRDPKSDSMLSVKTSSDRTLIDLAMTGKPKLDILMYLVHKGISILDLHDPSLSARTLEALLKSGFVPGGPESAIMNKVLATVETSESSVATVENACTLCCERGMDCVLQPCGHQLCCAECGGRLAVCPFCKKKCTVLRIIKC